MPSYNSYFFNFSIPSLNLSLKTLTEILFKRESYEIIGACLEIHKTLGNGFKEIVYKEAMELEFNRLNIPFEREKKFVIEYKGVVLPHYYYADFVVGGNIILEVKAQQALPETFSAQLINYLAVSKCPVGLLVNFGEGSLRYKRFVFTPKKSAQSV